MDLASKNIHTSTRGQQAHILLFDHRLVSQSGQMDQRQNRYLSSARDFRARGSGYDNISIETTWYQNGGNFKISDIWFSYREIKSKQTAKVVTLKLPKGLTYNLSF